VLCDRDDKNYVYTATTDEYEHSSFLTIIEGVIISIVIDGKGGAAVNTYLKQVLLLFFFLPLFIVAVVFM